MAARRFQLLLIPIILLGANTQSFGQGLSGSFRNLNGSLSSSFKFEENRFIKATVNVFGHSRFMEKGYFMIVTDSLFLFYEPYEDHANTEDHLITHQSTKKDSASLTLALELTNSMQEPLENATVIVKKQDDILFGALTDDQGLVTLYTEGFHASQVQLSLTGYGVTSIDLTPFWGYETDLRVVLRLQTDVGYSKVRKTEKYRIREDSSNSFILIDTSLEELLFERID